MRREPGEGDAPHMVQHLVDVDLGALDRAVREHVHALDKVADAVHLVLDQQAELAVRLARALLQELRRAADAGERVLHLMRQHGRHRRCAARGAAEVELPVQHLRRRGVLQRQHHAARQLRQQGAMG